MNDKKKIQVFILLILDLIESDDSDFASERDIVTMGLSIGGSKENYAYRISSNLIHQIHLCIILKQFGRCVDTF